MAERKKTVKKRKKRKRPLRSRAAVRFAGLCAGGAFAALFLFRWEHPPQPPAQPAYEEVHSFRPGLQKDIGRIDRTVYDVLYRWGIYDGDILFTEVEHRTVDEDVWDFTEMTVRLRDEETLRSVRTELLEELEALTPEVRVQGEEGAPGAAAYRVHAGKRYTHRILLVVPEQRTYPEPKRRLPRVAIIIDDLGYDRGLARAFASLDIPVALSVLPMAPRTADIAAEAARTGWELMLHLPMEPKGYPRLNPGPGALLSTMQAREIRDLVQRHLAEVPGALGVNNHMGSCFTEQGDKMAVVLGELHRKGLFFVDSKTTARSVAYDMARNMGIPAAKRSVFLDNDPARRAVGIQMERLVRVARHRGEAVGIAHPFPGTLEALKGEARKLSGQVEIVTISELVNRPGRGSAKIDSASHF